MKIALGRRPLYIFAAITAAPALFFLVAWICLASTKDLDACRLAQIIGIRHSYPLYPDPTQGVMSPWTFGPLPALLFLFSSIFARPTSQLLAAICLNACVILGPALWLNLRLAGKQHRAFGWLGFLVFLWCIFTHDSLAQVAFAVNADGLMLGFATCAVAILLDSRKKPQLAIAVVAMVLAACCKASAVPLLIVVPAYLLLAGDERRMIGWTIGAMMVAAMIVSVAFMVPFGARNMWHFMVTLPMSQPWLTAQANIISEGRLAELGDVFVTLLHDVLPTLALLAGFLLLGRFLTHEKQLKDNVWMMLPAMALLLVPAAVLGYLKMARHSEAFGAAHYFLVLAATAALIRTYRRCSDDAGRLIVISCVCVFSAWQAMAVLLTWHRPANLYQIIRNTYTNSHETAYTFAREHPGEVFFPWNTLSTLQAEGKLYHSEWGFNLYYRTHPNERIDVDRIHQFTPDRMRFIAFPEKHESERIRQVFLQASQRANIAQLPGFVAYTQTVQP